MNADERLHVHLAHPNLMLVLEYINGDLACEADTSVSGGTDVLTCTTEAEIIVFMEASDHTHIYAACKEHADGLLDRLCALHKPYTVLWRSAHGSACVPEEFAGG